MPDPIAFPRIPRTRGPAARSSTWWGRAWVRSFEELTVEEGERAAARRLARSGRLGAVVVLDSMASAVVDGDSETPGVAQVRVRRLDDDDWDRFAQEAARESGFVAALEAGDLPAALVEHADEAGVELLPGPGDIETACGCDAWTQPCGHALALLYQLAWHVDRDPYVLLLLRGRTREALLDQIQLRVRPGEGSTDPVEFGEGSTGAEELADARRRAAALLDLAADAPAGHGLADAAVAAYDEQVARLL